MPILENDDSADLLAKTDAANAVKLWPERSTTFNPLASMSGVFMTCIFLSILSSIHGRAPLSLETADIILLLAVPEPLADGDLDLVLELKEKLEYSTRNNNLRKLFVLHSAEI